MTPELYLHQTVHTLGGIPLLLASHIASLDRASRALFGRPFRCDAAQLAAEITALLRREQVPDDLSAFVRLELTPDSTLQMRYAGLSLYCGYDLRTVHPTAESLVYDLPFGEYPTSASESLGALARMQAQRRGARSVVRCNTEGMIRTADGAPVYAVAGHRIYTPPAAPSAAREVAAASIEAAGLTLTVEPLPREWLSRFDELFSVDHRGITSFARCDGTPYMSLTAERIARCAQRLTERFRKM